MEVGETLRKAWAAVEESGVPEQVHEVAFREAVRLLAPSATAAPLVPAAPLSGAPGGAGGGAATDGPADPAETAALEAEIYDKVASQTGVSRDKLEQVVHLDGDVLKVSIPGIKLGKNNAERARVVAQILTITRGFGLDESETDLDVIRAECDRLRVYDQNNFSGHMKALNGYVITGSGGNRRVRAKSGGLEAFPGLLESLVGAES
jgi:hypothetical protein